MNYIKREIDNFYKTYNILTYYMLGHKGFPAGGCFKNLMNNEPIKDIDMFFHNRNDFNDAIKLFKENTDLYVFSYENKKVVAYKHKYHNTRVELIQSIFGTPAGILDQFDFSITKMAMFTEVESGEDELIYNHYFIHHPNFFEHLQQKRLVLDDKILFPNSTFERSLKYKAYGYSLCRESKINLLQAIRNNNNPDDDLSKSLYDGLD